MYVYICIYIYVYIYQVVQGVLEKWGITKHIEEDFPAAWAGVDGNDMYVCTSVYTADDSSCVCLYLYMYAYV